MNNNDNNIITGGNNLNVNPSPTPQVSQPEVSVSTEQPVLEILSP